MERSHLPSGPQPETGPGAEPWRPAAAVTIVVRDPGAAGYGRHAAPPSAYGPADVHRLLPVPPPAPLVVVADAPGDDGDPGARDEVPAKGTGFLARLRLLPRAA